MRLISGYLCPRHESMSSPCDLSVTSWLALSSLALDSEIAGLSFCTRTSTLPKLLRDPRLWRVASIAPQYANLKEWLESVAQLVEHRPFKALVLGSSPSALTIKLL